MIVGLLRVPERQANGHRGNTNRAIEIVESWLVVDQRRKKH
ncbi:hypothetical protein [Bradyrhizobium sp. WD16]|nr:hypothetical protein [Bradyrhizobium sp. WD16]